LNYRSKELKGRG
jgi:hypothetical protein